MKIAATSANASAGKRRTHDVVPPLDDDRHERDESEIDRNDGESRPERPAHNTGETQQRGRDTKTNRHHEAPRRLPHDDVGVVHQARPNRVRRPAEHSPERR